jgi:hypothetical protein
MLGDQAQEIATVAISPVQHRGDRECSVEHITIMKDFRDAAKILYGAEFEADVHYQLDDVLDKYFVVVIGCHSICHSNGAILLR